MKRRKLVVSKGKVLGVLVSLILISNAFSSPIFTGLEKEEVTYEVRIFIEDRSQIDVLVNLDIVIIEDYYTFVSAIVDENGLEILKRNSLLFKIIAVRPLVVGENSYPLDPYARELTKSLIGSKSVNTVIIVAKDINGNPLENSHVCFFEKICSSYFYVGPTYTDSNGESIAYLPNGTYLINVSRNMHFMSKEVDISASGTIRFDASSDPISEIEVEVDLGGITPRGTVFLAPTDNVYNASAGFIDGIGTFYVTPGYYCLSFKNWNPPYYTLERDNLSMMSNANYMLTTNNTTAVTLNWKRNNESIQGWVALMRVPYVLGWLSTRSLDSNGSASVVCTQKNHQPQLSYTKQNWEYFFTSPVIEIKNIPSQTFNKNLGHLNMTIVTNKETYKCGDTMEVSFNVKDGWNNELNSIEVYGQLVYPVLRIKRYSNVVHQNTMFPFFGSLGGYNIWKYRKYKWQIPVGLSPGEYTVEISLDTGPYQGILKDSKTITVKREATKGNGGIFIGWGSLSSEEDIRNLQDHIPMLESHGISRLFITMARPICSNGQCDLRILDVITENSDEFSELIEKAHEESIEIHGVISCFGDGEEGWIEPDQSQKIDERKEEIKGIIKSIIEDYHVDGINLDYIRWKARDSEPFYTSDDAQIVTDAVRELRDYIENELACPDIHLSADVFAGSTYALEEFGFWPGILPQVGQDRKSMSEYLDFIVPMAYVNVHFFKYFVMSRERMPELGYPYLDVNPAIMTFARSPFFNWGENYSAASLEGLIEILEDKGYSIIGPIPGLFNDWGIAVNPNNENDFHEFGELTPTGIVYEAWLSKSIGCDDPVFFRFGLTDPDEWDAIGKYLTIIGYLETMFHSLNTISSNENKIKILNQENPQSKYLTAAYSEYDLWKFYLYDFLVLELAEKMEEIGIFSNDEKESTFNNANHEIQLLKEELIYRGMRLSDLQQSRKALISDFNGRIGDDPTLQLIKETVDYEIENISSYVHEYTIGINFFTPPHYTDWNKAIQPLALNNISLAESLQLLAYEMLEQAAGKGLDTSGVMAIMEKANELLLDAKRSYSFGNYIAANNLALQAMELYQQAIFILNQFP